MKRRTILIMVVVLIALGAFFYFSNRPDPEPQPEPRPFVWDVEMDELQTMSITLPRKGMSESWVKGEDRYWYFDEPDGAKVDMKRWGGGIPLLLSGPAANRTIVETATDDQLEIYGFDDPQMRIELILASGESIDIEVGDRTPDGQGHYIRLADSGDLYIVDYTWFDVLERLVLDPPYPVAE